MGESDEKQRESQGTGYNKAIFQQELTHFRDRKHAYALEFDKGLLTFSSLALGLSMTFVAQVFDQPQGIWAVVLCWISLGISVIATLLGFWFAQTSYQESEEDLISGYNKSRPPEAAKFSATVKGCTLFAGGGFIFGLLFLAIFVGCNINNTGEIMSDGKVNESEKSTPEKTEKKSHWRHDAAVAGAPNPLLMPDAPLDDTPSSDGDSGTRVELTKSDGPSDTKDAGPKVENSKK